MPPAAERPAADRERLRHREDKAHQAAEEGLHTKDFKKRLIRWSTRKSITVEARVLTRRLWICLRLGTAASTASDTLGISLELEAWILELQFTHLPSAEVRIGSSSIMNCVLPMAPIMCVPVARYHFSDMLSPVWQPQLLMKASCAKMWPLILWNSDSCSHDLAALSTLLL